MMLKNLGLLITVFTLNTSSCLAKIISINFEDPALVGTYYLDGELVLNTPVQIGTTGINGAADILAPPTNYTSGPNDGNAYLHSSVFSSIFIQASQNDLFNLVTLELGEYSSYTSNGAVTITGFKNNGNQITTTLQLDGFFDGLGGINDFQLITLDTNWSNLTRVEFDNSAYSLDNIQLDINPVPIPAAFWLFGSGVIGLIGFSKRK